MNKDDCFITFNKKAREFMERMSESYPEEEKIKQYILLFDVFERMDYKTPVNLFMDNLRPFGPQIMKKDEHFFKDDQYVNKAENLSGKLGLLKYWDTMTEDTKNSIWKYVQLLYVTGMAAQGHKEELSQVIKEVNSK
jgi:hypothetical protein